MQANELQKLLSDNLKKIRKEQKLSQFALGEKAEISENTVKSIELMRQWPSEKTLAAIASALNVEVYTLFLPAAQDLRLDSPATQQLKQAIAQNLKDYVNTTLLDIMGGQ